MPHGAMDKVKLMVGMEPSAEPELQDQIEDCFQLSRMERLYGFAICITAGLFCSFLSSLVFLKPTKFAILYSLGNILSLTSTGFLMGFWSQLKNMFKSHPRIVQQLSRRLPKVVLKSPNNRPHVVQQSSKCEETIYFCVWH